MKKKHRETLIIGGTSAGKVVQMNAIQKAISETHVFPKLPAADESEKECKPLSEKEKRAMKTHDVCEKKLQNLVLAYLHEASNDPLGKEFYFEKFETEWKVFAKIKNSQQRDIIVYPHAFKENVEHFIKLAEANQKNDLASEEMPETNEHRGEEDNGITS